MKSKVSALMDGELDKQDALNIIEAVRRSDELQAISEKKKYVSEGISLLLQQARRQLITAIDQYQSYTPLLDMSKRYYYEILKKFKEGQANPAELIDAQSQITFADLQQNVSLYQAWIYAAELERLTLDKQ